MKNIKLRIKIVLTNISRIIISFLFINLGNLFKNSLYVQASEYSYENISCYFAGPSYNNIINENGKNGNLNKLDISHVFIIIVPIVVIIVITAIIIIKHKNKKKDKKYNDK